MKFLSFLNIQTTPLSDRLVELFLNWSRENNMICNLSKSKELVVKKKNNNPQNEQICNIPHCNSLSLLGGYPTK